MDSPFFLVLRWLFSLWLLGWLLLPLSRRIFVNLPDGGLAAGRTFALVLISLLAFWLASLSLAPLSFAPFLLIALPLVSAAWLLRRDAARLEFVDWIQCNRRALLVSDVLFLIAFLFFLWVRARHSAIGDLEKPMDSAIMAATARAVFLPPPHPWLGGETFTNYYYFFHFIGGSLMRTFNTPPAYGYNLVYPLFCALFIAPLWSLCAALTKSLRYGLVAAIVVALLGHFEPLRQIFFTKQWPLSWWDTSRVIPHTINEYPAFTLLIGDAHGHFFALAVAALFCCLCYALFWPGSATTRLRWPWLSHRLLVLVSLALLGGAFVMGNTWDTPIYALLAVLCGVVSLRTDWQFPDWLQKTDAWMRQLALLHLRWTLIILNILVAIFIFLVRYALISPQIAGLILGLSIVAPTSIWGLARFGCKFPKGIQTVWILLPLILAPFVALPYLMRYKPQVSGAAVEWWSPPGVAFMLFWGGFLFLWLLAATSRARFNIPLAFAAVLSWFMCFLSPPLGVLGVLAVSLWILRSELVEAENNDTEYSGRDLFIAALAVIGVLALLAPLLFYIRGHFGGDLRHQDTVFKFFLQAWLLLGTAAICGALNAWQNFAENWRAVTRNAFLVAWSVPLLCSLTVLWTRVSREAPRAKDNYVYLTLNGARHLPPSDQNAIEWLRRNAGEKDIVLEAVGQIVNESGEQAMGGQYTTAARVSTLSGVPTVLGWPQHVMFWGGNWDEIGKRWEAVRRIYHWPGDDEALAALQELNVRYVFVGALEREYYPADALDRLRARLQIVYNEGGTEIYETPR